MLSPEKSPTHDASYDCSVEGSHSLLQAVPSPLTHSNTLRSCFNTIQHHWLYQPPLDDSCSLPYCLCCPWLHRPLIVPRGSKKLRNVKWMSRPNFDLREVGRRTPLTAKEPPQRPRGCGILYEAVRRAQYNAFPLQPLPPLPSLTPSGVACWVSLNRAFQPSPHLEQE